MNDEQPKKQLLPCPFCGMAPDHDLSDTLYPSGTYWREHTDIPIRSYHGLSDRQVGDAPCFKMVCNETHGGCGAQVSGDSEAETIAAWNRRPRAAREPLTDEQLVACIRLAGFTTWDSRMWGLKRQIEAAHGITGEDGS